jgi:hypothetical protein
MPVIIEVIPITNLQMIFGEAIIEDEEVEHISMLN